MSLQEIIAGLIAAGCGAWAVWYVIRTLRIQNRGGVWLRRRQL